MKYMKRKDVRRMMNYIRNKKKKVTIIDEYNNSMCVHEERKHTGIVKYYTLSKIEPDVCSCDYCLAVEFEDGYVFEIWLDTSYQLLSKYNDKQFIAGFINAGPWCYFKVILV